MTVPPLPTRRLRECVEAWPGAETGAYDPRCCRFPKSCSATVYDEHVVAEADLEPAAEPVPSTPADTRPPTVLRFRSASGRTEIAHRGDGTVALSVLTGSDVLSGDDIGRAARALRKAETDRLAGVLEQAERAAEPLAQGGIVTPDAQPEIEDPEELFEPYDPDDLPRMAPRRDPAMFRRVAFTQADLDERERAAYERGKAEGYDAAADELNDKALRAIKNAYRDGILEGRRRAVAIIEDHSEVNGELYRRMILTETGGGQDGQ